MMGRPERDTDLLAGVTLIRTREVNDVDTRERRCNTGVWSGWVVAVACRERQDGDESAAGGRLGAHGLGTGGKFSAVVLPRASRTALYGTPVTTNLALYCRAARRALDRVSRGS
jgi:hypothetical protein